VPIFNGKAMRTSSASWLRRSDLAYGLSFSIAPRFFSGFFFSGRCVRVRVCRLEQLQSTLCQKACVAGLQRPARPPLPLPVQQISDCCVLLSVLLAAGGVQL